MLTVPADAAWLVLWGLYVMGGLGCVVGALGTLALQRWGKRGSSKDKPPGVYGEFGTVSIDDLLTMPITGLSAEALEQAQQIADMLADTYWTPEHTP